MEAYTPKDFLPDPSQWQKRGGQPRTRRKRDGSPKAVKFCQINHLRVTNCGFHGLRDECKMTKLSGHGRSASALSPTKIRDSVATRPADIASAVASTGLIRANSTAFQASSTSRSSSASKQSVTGISSTNTTTMIETAMTTSLHIEKSSTLLCPPSSQIHPDSHHQKQSPWFWRRKAASLVRSASTAKGKNDGAPGWGSSDKPPTDEAYESKTSTLSSAVTVDGVDRPLLIESISVTRSASTRETKAGKKGFLRFLRTSFASKSKRSSDSEKMNPPLSMTHSGFEMAAGNQSNIAKAFVDPNNRLSRASQFNQTQNTISSIESFDSQETSESISTSGDILQRNRHNKNINGLNADVLCFPNETIITAANQRSMNPSTTSGRSQSANARSFQNQIEIEQQTPKTARVDNVCCNEMKPSLTEFQQQSSGGRVRTSVQQASKTYAARYPQPNVISYEDAFPRKGTLARPAIQPDTQALCAHFNNNYACSDGNIYDQPPPVELVSNNNCRLSNSYQRLNTQMIPTPASNLEMPSSQSIPPIPSTAPSVRRPFNGTSKRCNYEHDDFSADEDEEGAGGTLSRRKPVPPLGLMMNRCSRESLNPVGNHEKTPVPRGNTPARHPKPHATAAVPPSPQIPRHMQPPNSAAALAQKPKMTRCRTVGAMPKDGDKPPPHQNQSQTPFEGSLCLKRVARPDLEHERHKDTSLRITIHESKNLAPQKQYFCDICLDRKLYARTTSKMSRETVFWGECFDLNNLSELNFITIYLYREADFHKESSKRRKPSTSQNQLIAFLTIAVSDLSGKHETQQWYTMTPASMLPSSESLLNSAASPVSRQSVASFGTVDAASALTASAAAHTVAKRSISLAGPNPSSMLANRMRKLSKPNLSGSECKVNGSETSQNGNGLPQIRLAVQYQSVDVLPLSNYDELQKLVVEKSPSIVQYLEPLISTKKKEEIARCLVNIHEKASESDVAVFLSSIVDQELDTHDNLSLLFRSNSIGSKAVENYIKLVGAEYLQKLLRGFIENQIASPEELEVDPSRLALQSPSLTTSDGSRSSHSDHIQSTVIQRNQAALVRMVRDVWQRLQESLEYFPADLRETLASIRRPVELRHGRDVGDQLVSGCLFLRYLCPAIHGPALFGLTNALPTDERVCRNLTLLAKVLQTMANFSHFEAKEKYMRFLNDLVIHLEPDMREFLRAVSTEHCKRSPKSKEPGTPDCHASIDLGYELTMLHLALSNVVDEHKKIPQSLHELPGILTTISHMLASPGLQRGAMRSATTTALDQATAFRNHTMPGTPLVLGYLPGSELPATPVSLDSSNGQYTIGCKLMSDPIDSPVSLGGSRQAFFGDSFEPHRELLYRTNVDRATKGETPQATLSLGSNMELPKISSPPPRPPNNSATTTSIPQNVIPIGTRSASLRKTNGDHSSPSQRGQPDGNSNNTLPSGQKWLSGSDLNEGLPVLNFPPPPTSQPVARDAGLGGSSSNIRMGTRAIRMSRERDLPGSIEPEEKRQMGVVPVIFQCEQSPAGRVSSARSVDSVSSSSSLSISPSQPPASASAVFAENPGYYDSSICGGLAGGAGDSPAAFVNTPASIHRRFRNDSNNNNNNNPALLSKVHNLLFGEGSGLGEYQNVQGMTRMFPDESKRRLAQEAGDANNLETLEHRLRAMEQHLCQERKDMQYVVVSNMRIIDNQEKCINELVEEINRLRLLRQKSKQARSMGGNVSEPR